MIKKDYITLGIGIIAGVGISVAGLSHATQNTSNKDTSKKQEIASQQDAESITNNKGYISESKAKEIMQNKVLGATIKDFELDEDGTPEYEAQLVKGDIEYGISVDVYTGKITLFEKDDINDDKDDVDDKDDDKDDKDDVDDKDGDKDDKDDDDDND